MKLHDFMRAAKQCLQRRAAEELGSNFAEPLVAQIADAAGKHDTKSSYREVQA